MPRTTKSPQGHEDEEADRDTADARGVEANDRAQSTLVDEELDQPDDAEDDDAEDDDENIELDDLAAMEGPDA